MWKLTTGRISGRRDAFVGDVQRRGTNVLRPSARGDSFFADLCPMWPCFGFRSSLGVCPTTVALNETVRLPLRSQLIACICRRRGKGGAYFSALQNKSFLSKITPLIAYNDLKVNLEHKIFHIATDKIRSKSQKYWFLIELFKYSELYWKLN